MAASGVTLTGDWRSFGHAVRNLENFPYQRFHASSGHTIDNQMQRRFDAQRGPDGRPWKKSARVKSRGGKTLTDSARLRNSTTQIATARQVQRGTNVIYAAIHQFGGTITAKKAKALKFAIPGVGFRTVKKVKIPARPFMGFSPEDIRELARELQDFIRELTRK